MATQHCARRLLHLVGATPVTLKSSPSSCRVVAAPQQQQPQQGQLLSQTDLTTFFKDYVPKAAAGDDMVYKYAGDKQQGEVNTKQFGGSLFSHSM